MTDCDLPLPAEDALWLAAGLRALADETEGAADAAAMLEAALEDEVARQVKLDLAERSAVKDVLARGNGTVKRSPALTALTDRLAADGC